MGFDQTMVGKRVRETETGDLGIVTGVGVTDSSVFVEWITGENKGSLLWIGLAHVVFTDPLPVLEEITIDGKRYKLIPMD